MNTDFADVEADHRQFNFSRFDESFPEKRAFFLEDAGIFDFIFNGAEAVYRYWDATQCAVFTLRMAQLALEEELQKETAFLESYDIVHRAVDARFDVRGSDLSLLVMMCLQNKGKVSLHRRKQFRYTVPEAVFDYIEEVAQAELARQMASVEDGSSEAAE